jgi:protein tyrosine phosphatase
MRIIWCCLSIAALLTSSFLSCMSDTERLEKLESVVEKDSKQIPRHLLRWLDSQTVPLEPSAINGDYEKIKDMIRKISKQIKKESTIYCKPENIRKNFLQNIPVIDETRTLRHKNDFYINANDVLTPLQEYIVAQAPLESTVNDFWQAIIDAKVITIVNVSMPTDGGGKPVYWSKNRFPFSISGWTVECIPGEETLDTNGEAFEQRIVKRIFLASNEETKERRVITQIHYENWPDNGAPDLLLFYRFLHLISRIHPLASSPLFVHCAAGIGRSGTFVAAHSLIKEIETCHPATINIPKRIVELRMQRAYLVSTIEQFAAIYDAVRRCAQEQVMEPDHESQELVDIVQERILSKRTNKCEK